MDMAGLRGDRHRGVHLLPIQRHERGPPQAQFHFDIRENLDTVSKYIQYYLTVRVPREFEQTLRLAPPLPILFGVKAVSLTLQRSSILGEGLAHGCVQPHERQSAGGHLRPSVYGGRGLGWAATHRRSGPREPRHWDRIEGRRKGAGDVLWSQASVSDTSSSINITVRTLCGADTLA